MSSASAPGKVVLAGEYAVLDGHPAIVAAIDRRAVARAVAAPPPPSPFVAVAIATLIDELGAEDPAVARARTLAVDTAALHRGEAKLGLGSSAAATVAFLAAALATADRARLHRLAHRAHGDAQAALAPDARGSGLDVAAAVRGGVLRVTPAPDRVGPPAALPLALPAGLILVFLWTGRPADTRALVAAVAAAARARPDAHRAAIGAIAAAAAALAAAGPDGAAAAVDAIEAGERALAALAAASGAPLVHPAHARIAALARRAGGAAKPTGAGGGDLALAAFADPEAAGRFRAACAADGIVDLGLAVDPHGARLEEGDLRRPAG